MANRNPLSEIIYVSRWLLLPFYLGLIFVQGLFAYRFVIEIYKLLANAMRPSESDLMMGVLNVIDIVLISNLLAMIIIGGYEIFVSRLNLGNSRDEPTWLGSASNGALKIKLAISLVAISAVHLLRSFIDIDNQSDHAIMWQSAVVFLFVIIALAMAWIDRNGEAVPAATRRS